MIPSIDEASLALDFEFDTLMHFELPKKIVPIVIDDPMFIDAYHLHFECSIFVRDTSRITGLSTSLRIEYCLIEDDICSIFIRAGFDDGRSSREYGGISEIDEFCHKDKL